MAGNEGPKSILSGKPEAVYVKAGQPRKAEAFKPQSVSEADIWSGEYWIKRGEHGNLTSKNKPVPSLEGLPEGTYVKNGELVTTKQNISDDDRYQPRVLTRPAPLAKIPKDETGTAIIHSPNKKYPIVTIDKSVVPTEPDIVADADATKDDTEVTGATGATVTEGAAVPKNEDFSKSEPYRKLHQKIEAALDEDPARLEELVPRVAGESDKAYKLRVLIEVKKALAEGRSMDPRDSELPLMKFVVKTGLLNEMHILQAVEEDIKIANEAATDAVVGKLQDQLRGEGSDDADGSMDGTAAAQDAGEEAQVKDDFLKSEAYQRLHGEIEKAITETASDFEKFHPRKADESVTAYRIRMLEELKRIADLNSGKNAYGSSDPVVQYMHKSGLLKDPDFARALNEDLLTAYKKVADEIYEAKIRPGSPNATAPVDATVSPVVTPAAPDNIEPAPLNDGTSQAEQKGAGEPNTEPTRIEPTEPTTTTNPTPVITPTPVSRGPLQTSFSIGIGVMDNRAQREILNGANFVRALDMNEPNTGFRRILKSIWQRGLLKGNFDVRAMRFAAMVRDTAMSESGLRLEDGVPIEITDDLLQKALDEGKKLRKKSFWDKVRDRASSITGIILNSDQRFALEWLRENPGEIDARRKATIDEQTKIGERYALRADGVDINEANRSVISADRKETRHRLSTLLEEPQDKWVDGKSRYATVQEKIKNMVRAYAQPGSTVTREQLIVQLNNMVKADILHHLSPELQKELQGTEFASNIVSAADTVKSNWDAYNTIDAGDAAAGGKPPLDNLEFDVLIGRADWGGARDKELGTKLGASMNERLAKRLAERGFGPSEKVMSLAGMFYDLKSYGALYTAAAFTPIFKSQLGRVAGVGVGTGLIAGLREGGLYIASDGRLKGFGGRYLTDFGAANLEMARGRVRPDRAKVLETMQEAMVVPKKVGDLASSITDILAKGELSDADKKNLLSAVAHAKARMTLTDASSVSKGRMDLAAPQNFIGFTEGAENAEYTALRTAVFQGVIKLGQERIGPDVIDTATLIDQAQLKLHSDPERVEQWLVSTNEMTKDEAAAAVREYYVDREIEEGQGLNDRMRRLQKLSMRRGVKVGVSAAVLGTAFRGGLEVAKGGWHEASAAYGDWHTYKDNWDSVIHEPNTITKTIHGDGNGGYTADLTSLQRAVLRAEHLDRLVPGQTRFEPIQYVDGVPLALPKDVHIITTQSGDRVIFDGGTGQIHNLADNTFGTHDWDRDGVPDLSFVRQNVNNGTIFDTDPHDEFPGFIFDKHSATDAVFGTIAKKDIVVDGHTIHTAIPAGTVWQHEPDANGIEHWNLVSTDNPTMRLIDDAHFNADGSIDTTHLGPASLLTPADIKVGPDANTVTANALTQNALNTLRMNTVNTTHAASILDVQGNIDQHGPWGEHVTEVVGRKWHSTNNSQLGLHTIKRGDSAVVSMQTIMDRSPYVRSVVEGGGKDYGWYLTVGGHGKEGIFIPGHGPEFAFDPHDTTTHVTLGDGSFKTPAELYQIAVNHDKFVDIPGGDYASQLTHRPDLWTLGGGHIEAGRMITNPDGTHTFEAFGTIDATGNLHDVVVTGAESLPGSEAGQAVTQEVVNTFSAPDLGESAYSIIPPFAEMPNFVIGGVPYGIERERTIKKGTDGEQRPPERAPRTPVVTVIPPVPPVMPPSRSTPPPVRSAAPAPADSDIIEGRVVGRSADSGVTTPPVDASAGASKATSATTENLPEDATINQRKDAYATEMTNLEMGAHNAMDEFIRTADMSDIIAKLNGLELVVSEADVEKLKEDPTKRMNFIGGFLSDVDKGVHAKFSRDKNDSYIAAVQEYLVPTAENQLDDPEQFGSFKFTPREVRMALDIMKDFQDVPDFPPPNPTFFKVMTGEFGLTADQLQEVLREFEDADQFAYFALGRQTFANEMDRIKYALSAATIPVPTTTTSAPEMPLPPGYPNSAGATPAVPASPAASPTPAEAPAETPKSVVVDSGVTTPATPDAPKAIDDEKPPADATEDEVTAFYEKKIKDLQTRAEGIFDQLVSSSSPEEIVTRLGEVGINIDRRLAQVVKKDRDELGALIERHIHKIVEREFISFDFTDQALLLKIDKAVKKHLELDSKIREDVGDFDLNPVAAVNIAKIEISRGNSFAERNRARKQIREMYPEITSDKQADAILYLALNEVGPIFMNTGELTKAVSAEVNRLDVALNTVVVPAADAEKSPEPTARDKEDDADVVEQVTTPEQAKINERMSGYTERIDKLETEASGMLDTFLTTTDTAVIIAKLREIGIDGFTEDDIDTYKEDQREREHFASDLFDAIKAKITTHIIGDGSSAEYLGAMHEYFAAMLTNPQIRSKTSIFEFAPDQIKEITQIILENEEKEEQTNEDEKSPTLIAICTKYNMSYDLGENVLDIFSDAQSYTVTSLGASEFERQMKVLKEVLSGVSIPTPGGAPSQAPAATSATSGPAAKPASAPARELTSANAPLEPSLRERITGVRYKSNGEVEAADPKDITEAKNRRNHERVGIHTDLFNFVRSGPPDVKLRYVIDRYLPGRTEPVDFDRLRNDVSYSYNIANEIAGRFERREFGRIMRDDGKRFDDVVMSRMEGRLEQMRGKNYDFIGSFTWSQGDFKVIQGLASQAEQKASNDPEGARSILLSAIANRFGMNLEHAGSVLDLCSAAYAIALEEAKPALLLAPLESFHGEFKVILNIMEHGSQ